MNIIKGLPPQFPNNSYIALDTEIFGMNDKTLHRPTSGKFACLTVCPNSDDVYIIENETYLPEVFARLNNCIWVIHNAKWDLTMWRRWADIQPRKRLWDTLLIERILWGGYFDTFGLNDLSRRYLDEYLEKDTREEFKTATTMDTGRIEYACRDAINTWRICEFQRKILTKSDWRIWTEVDRDALWAVLDFKGMAINVDKWMELAKNNKQYADELKAQLPFNPDSPKQVKEYLGVRGFKGIKNAQADTIKNLIKRYPKAEAVSLAIAQQEYKMYAKRASTYGERFISDHLEDDEDVPTIFPDWEVTKALTGRMACSAPNLQNIPTRDTKVFRECFIARPNHKIVIWDYSAQEPRITAYLSQDKRLIQIFKEGKDVYCEMALDIHNKVIDKRDPLRSDMKPIFLGATYGLSKYGLAKKLDCSIDDAEWYLSTFFKKFPGVADYVKHQQLEKKYVKTILGRKSWLNPYDETNKGERNSLNSPIQGSAGDMIKQAFSMMHKEWKFDFPYSVIDVVHDEIGADVPEEYAEDVRTFGRDCCIAVSEKMCAGIPFSVDDYVGENWACKE
jgi:DNA polymerase-1